MTSTYTKIRVNETHDGQVIELVLNSPKGNVLDRQMMTELTQAVSAAGMNRRVKALVFRGEGDHFSFGASVAEHTKALVPDMLRVFRALFVRLIDRKIPLIAVVKGQCLGGAMELISLCHWVYCSEAAAFGQPEIVLGVFPPVAALILPRKIGQMAADDLVLTGRTISATEAMKLGLVTGVSSDPDLEVEMLLEKHILPRSAASLRYAAEASRYEMHQALIHHLETLETIYVKELMETADANEGINAFLEKRKPTWKNA